MSAVLRLAPVLPPPDPDAIMRYARGRRDDATDPLLDEVIREGEPAVDARLCYLETAVCVCENRVFFDGCEAESRDLAAHLWGYKRAVLFAATVGAHADRVIARAERSSPAKALLFDAYFTERVEALCDLFTARYNEPFRRFSPGYGDLPLGFQRDLFRVLDCPRAIGVTLGDQLLMMPTKSVTAIVGVKEKQP